MTLVKLTNATKYYLDITYNVEIKKNKIHLIKGDNGVGKTTLIHLILNYIKPDKGEVKRYKDFKSSYVSEHQIIPHFLKAENYLDDLCRIKNGKVDEYLLENFKVPLNKLIKELSFGNRQKLILLGAFIGDDDLLILDEPTNGLDQEGINILVQRLKEEIKKTIIIISHEHKHFESLKPAVINL